MPVEFISATHTTPTTEATAGGRRSRFDLRAELARRPQTRTPVPVGGGSGG